MGAPELEERRPESAGRDGGEDEEDGDAPPSSSKAAAKVERGKEKQGEEENENENENRGDGDGEAKPTTTKGGGGKDDDEGGDGDGSQAQDGEPVPRYKGVTKWFNSQKGNPRRWLNCTGRRARGEKINSKELMLTFFVSREREGRATENFLVRSSSTSKKRWKLSSILTFSFTPARRSFRSRLGPTLTRRDAHVPSLSSCTNETPGFGFITPADGSDDVFVHQVRKRERFRPFFFLPFFVDLLYLKKRKGKKNSGSFS